MKFWPTLIFLLISLAFAPQIQAGNHNVATLTTDDGFAKSALKPIQLITGQWEIISYTDNKNNREIPLGMIGVTVTTLFNSNGTYVTTTVNNNGPKKEEGIWSFNEKEQIIQMSTEKGEEGLSYAVKKLDEKSMIIEIKNRTTKMRKLDL